MQVTLEQALQLAMQHHQAGRLAEAEPIYRQILAAQPDHPGALHYLGMIAHQVGQHEQAQQLMQRSVELVPASAEFQQNLGLVLHAMGRFEESIERCRIAIGLQPRMASAHNNLGNSLQSLGRIDESIDAFKKAIQLNPNYVEAITNLGTAYEIKDEFAAAIAEYRRAMQVNPAFAGVHANLANVLLLLGRIDETIALNRHAVAHIPNHWPLVSNLLMNFHYAPGLSPQEILRLHREQTTQLDQLTAFAPPHANDRSPDRKLRIGYVSSDFREHPIAYFIEPILRHHDHKNFEIICYSDVPIPDAITARLERLAAAWKPVFGMTDGDFVQLVRSDQVDLLIELSVHTAGNRLLAMAHKPAPIQLTYLGFAGTTGLKAIDYRVTDETVDPPEIPDDQVGTEKLLRLPNVFCAYDPPEATPPSASPALASNGLTFGALCTLAKVNADVIDLWCNLLKEIPNSHLLIRARGLTDAPTADEIARRFEAHGIARERLELLGKAALPEYLQTFNRIDIELDPFPFSAHTTTCHALWMGVPVITLTGETPVSRVSASILSACGLADLIAHSTEEYISIATSLASDTNRLNDLRTTMRDRMKNSPLLDGVTLTKNLESQYRKVWHDYCVARAV